MFVKQMVTTIDSAKSNRWGSLGLFARPTHINLNEDIDKSFKC